MNVMMKSLCSIKQYILYTYYFILLLKSTKFIYNNKTIEGEKNRIYKQDKSVKKQTNMATVQNASPYKDAGPTAGETVTKTDDSFNDSKSIGLDGVSRINYI